MLSDSALLWTRIAAGIALLFVANFGYAIWKARRQASSSKLWPMAPGEIIASEVKLPATPSSDDDTDSSFELRYRYRVGGKDYEGTHIHAGREAMTTRQFAEELKAKYPLGSRVDVHYRPNRPATAVLEPKNTGNIAALIAFLVVFCCIAAVLVAHAIAGKVLTNQNGVPLFVFLLPLASMVIGIGGIYGYAQMRRRLNESARWPIAMGAITGSSVTEVVDTSRDSKGHETSSLNYRADIRFAYKVGGREYHSTNWKWGWTKFYGSPEHAQEIVAAHPKGKSVPVYYDPKQPETAVLEPANKQGTAAPLIVALVFGGGGALMLWALTVMR